MAGAAARSLRRVRTDASASRRRAEEQGSSDGSGLMMEVELGFLVSKKVQRCRRIAEGSRPTVESDHNSCSVFGTRHACSGLSLFG